MANIPNSQSNVYIKQGTDSNGETCFDAHSGFKFGIMYNNNGVYPSCGIGNVRGNSCIYLSISMMHHYDKETNVSNWICTKYSPGSFRSPIAILLNDATFHVNNVAYNSGVYILSAPNKIYELNEIIPDSDITVTKLG